MMNEEKIINEETQVKIIDPSLVKKALPPRDKNGHKGSYGHVAVVGGAYGMLGAPILAAGGALRAGAGLVTVCGCSELMLPLAANFPAAMTKPLDTPGYLGPGQSAEVLDFVRDKILVTGMGLGRKAETLAFASMLLRCPCRGRVLDADALYALAERGLLLGAAGANTVLTPHPGEMAVILGCDIKIVQSDRRGAVLAAAAKYGAVTVLKGHETLVCADGCIYQNPTGNPGMGTGGSGDVLAGIIGALMAQGASAKLAAVAGVYLHGLAGDLAAAELTEQALMADDIIAYLPKALSLVLNPA